MPTLLRPTASGLLLAGFAAASALFVTAGCQSKEKTENSLPPGTRVAPWESPAFAPKRLEGYRYPGPESLFTVFDSMDRLDSLFGDRSRWKADPKGIDTLRVDQLFDTAFVFPRIPEAARPYAYDDSYRDDTLYRNYFGNGLFTQDHPCAVTYVLSDPFLHPARWLKAGLSQAAMVGALGRPAYWLGDTATAVLRFQSHHVENPLPAGAEADSAVNLGAPPTVVYEAADFYFLNDSLFAAVLKKSQPCH